MAVPMTKQDPTEARSLHDVRESKGLTVDELAGKTEFMVTSSTVRRIERGDVSPERRTRLLLARALGVNVDQITWP